MQTIAVIGASLAGFSAAQQLRAHGFDGRLAIVGAEAEPPYDRPPLSKDFLAGELSSTDLALAEQADLDELNAEWHLGRHATELRPTAGTVKLRDGHEIRTDGVIVATGARPRTLPGAERITGVHQLRSLADATALRAELHGAYGTRPDVVVVGGGFIGSEVAATCAGMGLEATIVDGNELPLSPVLGSWMAGVCADLHNEHGVRLRCGRRVTELLTDGARVRGVLLDDGERLDADVVVLGVGVRPNTEWLAGSGLELDDGVLCDSGCRTSNPAVAAIGDVARVYHQDLGTSVRTEHWTNATQQASTAVANLLAGHTARQHDAVPYFWTDQYGVRIQFAGTPLPGDDVTIVDGDVADRRFLANYTRGGAQVATLAFNNPRAFARARRALAKPVPAPAR